MTWENFVSLGLTKIKEPRRGGKNSRERGNRQLCNNNVDIAI